MWIIFYSNNFLVCRGLNIANPISIYCKNKKFVLLGNYNFEYG